MQHKAVFGMIEKHDLYNVVHDMIEQLMDLDIEQSIRMLTEKEETNSSVAMAKLKIPSNVVVAKLEHNSMYLYLVSISNYSCKKKKQFPVFQYDLLESSARNFQIILLTLYFLVT